MAGEKTSLARDLIDLLREFSAREVRFLIVGAYALAAHGRPRATGDLDVWIEASPANAERALDALRAFGAPLGDLTSRDLATPGVVFQIGVAPVRIDVLTSVSGVSFAEAWPARIAAAFDGMEVPVISREHLISNKRATGRPQDLVDVGSLERDGERKP